LYHHSNFAISAGINSKINSLISDKYLLSKKDNCLNALISVAVMMSVFQIAQQFSVLSAIGHVQYSSSFYTVNQKKVPVCFQL